MAPATWTLTSPCDGVGPCDLERCDSAGCGDTGSGEPRGTGYVVRWSSPMSWGEPQCSGGTYDNTVTWAVSGKATTSR